METTDVATTTAPATIAATVPPAPRARRSAGLVVGRLAGAPVVLTPSWFVAALVLTVVFAPNVMRAAGNLHWAGVAGISFAFALLLALSVFLHEAAHALVASRQGQTVSEVAVTLWGGHTAFANQAKGPGAAAAVAIVGPATNLLLAGVFYAGFQMLPRGSIVALLFYAAFFSNAFVGLFNLLPGLPLDGGQILESAVWAATGWRTRGTVAAGWVGRLVAVGVVAWALVLPLARGQGVNPTSALWMVLIAAFLWQGAGQAIALAARRERVARYAARTLAVNTVTLPLTASAADAVTSSERWQQGSAGGSPVVVAVVGAGGEPIGWVDQGALARVPEAARARTAVTAALVPFAAGSAVPVSLTGLPLLTHIDATSAGARIVPVTDDEGRLAGVIDIRDLAATLAADRGPKGKG